MNAHELKQKQVRLTKLEAEIAEEQAALRTKQSAVDKLRSEANAIRNSIQEFLEAQERANQEPIITEHAFLRYFERVCKYDLERVKALILTPDVLAQIKKLGNGTYPVERAGGGFKIKVQNGAVVTVI